MKLFDSSDIIGILLAVFTFVVPAISRVLDKKKKEKKNIEAQFPQEELPNENPDVGKPVKNEELEELFNVLMGKEEVMEEPHTEYEDDTEPEPEIGAEETPALDTIQEEVTSQTQNISYETEVVEVSGEKNEENSVKESLKRNPKEAVILSEILTPKFKEYN